jgi:hypothetical protein
MSTALNSGSHTEAARLTEDSNCARNKASCKNYSSGTIGSLPMKRSRQFQNGLTGLETAAIPQRSTEWAYVRAENKG